MSLEKNIDLLGIGNAITDILISVDYQFLEKMKFNAGTMHLVDFNSINEILEKFRDFKVSAGGSVANTISLASNLGNRCAFLGKRKNDDRGKMFSKSMNASNILLPNREVEIGDPSSTCLVMITPNGERTMLTYLGASTSLSQDDVDLKLLENTKIVYLEGYLFDLPEAKNLFNIIADKQEEYDFELALSLSDPFCVKRHKEDFLKLLEKKIKIIFSNQEEIESLFDCDIENALLKSSNKALISICTQGEKGSTLCKNGKFIKRNAYKINVKDTTGAGDSFAAGFLHGYINNYSLSKCSELGNYCAAETVKVIGARIDSNIKELLEKNKILEN
ncbi:MAG: 2-dehydro-3-deoxygluconokinase [Alphaproteobacteria bacterium MarineAlpha9_Bin4]|nr:adenosine kinase [Pelagibacterales bacterium]PPR25356.1 MAG: 2-dehydro-3-deoxygluconokinase [Alphaproteobacteria bacterium MarineAlpha9_Bin4]|tara:strand:+ start:604 stop:1602 length:999 start_codon:yes stop_codon:yes gene_type:complete